MPQLSGIKIMVSKDLVSGGKYQIIAIDDFKSPKGDLGLKVQLVSMDKSDKTDYSTILWKRPQIGIKSKLGAFINALAEYNEETGEITKVNTDTWVGICILAKRWNDKDREIEVISEKD